MPFCQRKCPYCDFNTYAGLETLFGAYVGALCAELAAGAERLAGRPVETVFVGGGTPTVLPTPLLARVFTAIHDGFHIAPDAEITCEANPGTVDRARFADLVALGVNRLSLGAQSFQPAELDLLGRIHDAEDVVRAVEAARGAGLENLNLDFMFGLPGQTAAGWGDTLSRALTLAPTHLSLYSLIVEPETPLARWVADGRVAAPDDDVAAELYEQAMDRLAEAGFGHYEISNWARTPGHVARHNLGYWRNGEYLGVGPGAHSHLVDGPGGAGRRWGNIRPVPEYIGRVARDEPVAEPGETIDRRLAMAETMMLGLRLVEEGVPFDRFQRLHGADLRAVFTAELEEMSAWGLVELDAERVRLTGRGLMVGDRVFERFLPTSD